MRRAIKDPAVLALKRDGQFYMLDGMNRLMAQVLRGRCSVVAYVGDAALKKVGYGLLRRKT